MDNDCSTFGWQKAFDGVLVDPSFPRTLWAFNPWMQLDLGGVRFDVQAIRITARPDSSFILANSMAVHLSTTADDFALVGAACSRGLSFSAAEVKTVTCPLGVAARYVTLRREGVTDQLSLAEVAIVISGDAPTQLPTDAPAGTPMQAPTDVATGAY